MVRYSKPLSLSLPEFVFESMTDFIDILWVVRGRQIALKESVL